MERWWCLRAGGERAAWTKRAGGRVAAHPHALHRSRRLEGAAVTRQCSAAVAWEAAEAAMWEAVRGGDAVVGRQNLAHCMDFAKFPGGFKPFFCGPATLAASASLAVQV